EHTADGRPAGPDGPRGLLRARLAAIAEYLARLLRPEGAAVPHTLSDLVPPDGLDIDRDDLGGYALGGGGPVRAPPRPRPLRCTCGPPMRGTPTGPGGGGTTPRIASSPSSRRPRSARRGTCGPRRCQRPCPARPRPRGCAGL